MKPPGQTGGDGISILRRSELTTATLGADLVIQQAVQNLALIDGRKFVIRYFALIQAGRLYLHRRGAVVVHHVPYDRDSADYDVQISPAGSIRAAPDVDNWLLTLDSLNDGSAWWASVRQRLHDIIPALQPLLDISGADHDRYCLIGGDALVEASGEARLIELNFYCNIWCERSLIDRKVMQPMMRDTVAKLLNVPNDSCEFAEVEREMAHPAVLHVA